MPILHLLLLKKLSVLENENQELRENNSHLYNQIKGVFLTLNYIQ